MLLLQRQLASLGFATPVTGYFDSATARAVTAFRKTNGLGTTGYADGTVYGKLLRGQGAFKLAHPTAGKNGKHVEFDWSRQVLVLAQKAARLPGLPRVVGQALDAHGLRHASSSTSRRRAPTPTGWSTRATSSAATRSTDTWTCRPTPASHGCLRVPIPNARQIYDWVDIGDPIFVYR